MSQTMIDAAPDTSLCIEKVDFSLRTFGSFLRSVRNATSISIRDFEDKVHKTRAYLSDIERDKSNPPDKELLDLMVQQLQLTGYPRIVNRLYDLAAFKRNAVPDDLKQWLMEEPTHRDLVRKCRDKKLTKTQIKTLMKIVEDL